MITSSRSKSSISWSARQESGGRLSPSNVSVTERSSGIRCLSRKADTSREVKVFGLALILKSSYPGLLKISFIGSFWSCSEEFAAISGASSDMAGPRVNIGLSVTASMCICSSFCSVKWSSITLVMGLRLWSPRLLQVVTSKRRRPFQVKWIDGCVSWLNPWRLHHAKRTSFSPCDIFRRTSNGVVFSISDDITIWTVGSSIGTGDWLKRGLEVFEAVGMFDNWDGRGNCASG